MTSADQVGVRNEIDPFRIQVPQRDIDDLNARLDRIRRPDQLPGVGWTYGIPNDVLHALAKRWRHEYDWRQAEAQLNQWPQYTTVIDGATVHFAHIVSPEQGAVPLLITHGWPGSLVEFIHVAGPLSNPSAHGAPGAQAFHLVMPSIPGFGFSGPTTSPGWGVHRIALAFGELMSRLGYTKYAVQGGDWGATIGREVGRIRPNNVIGVHLNFMRWAAVWTEPTSAELNALAPYEREQVLASWRRTERWNRDQSGYFLEQQTRPQAIAHALADSPAGQLAWIGEKFHEWTDPTQGAWGGISEDTILTNIAVYWFTNTAGSSARIYYEFGLEDNSAKSSPTPTAVAIFPYDIALPVRSIAERTHNIVRWNTFEKGGHFAAMEQPEILVTDIREFFHGLLARKP
nr:epoxide hydrolase family protein [Mycobacteroides abscessus]